MENNTQIKPREWHVIISIAVGTVVVATLLILYFLNVIPANKSQLSTTILTTCGIFIGFIISALGVYYSIPLKPELRERLVKQGYYRQIARNFIISSIVFFSSIVCCLIVLIVENTASAAFYSILNPFIIGSFICGLSLCILTSFNFFIIVTKH